MCGIFGFSGNFDVSVLEGMKARQHHRGPDSDGIWCSDNQNMGLGQNRLSIIDLSDAGKQPMFSEDQSIVLVFNGEIYNYRELKSSLIEKGYGFKSDTDSEVLIYLYKEYGVKMLDFIRGMFAFAIYDRGNEELFIARDHFGIKPLYYSMYDGNFVFASEMKTLLEDKNIPRDINFDSINNHLTFLWCPFPNTILKSVLKMPPGTAFRIKEGQIIDTITFYDVKFEQEEKTEGQAVEELDLLMEASIKEQLISDVPSGAFLSGGLDSSLIVAYMRKLNPDKKLKAYTISIEQSSMEGNPNDLPYARKVAELFDVDLEEISISSDEMIKHIENITYILDEPLADPASINVQLISEMARKQGYYVLLSGAGGDDIFSGYRRHKAIHIDKSLYKIPRFIRNLIGGIEPLLPSSIPKIRRLKKFLYRFSDSITKRMFGYFYWTKDDLKNKILSENAKQRIKNSADSYLLKEVSKLDKNEDLLNKCLYLDTRFFLTDHNLNYTDKMCMYNSVEGRVPFMDYRIVDWAGKLPVDLKYKNGQAKYILKKLAEKYLPLDIIYRPKTGFGAPLRDWIKNDFEELYSKYFNKDVIERQNIFDYAELWTLINETKKNKKDGAYTIFSILSITIWVEKFVYEKD